ncbi:MAG: FHIPEP family type III secretion protein, partial [Desulfobacterales bacterium]|nr:FHIPEP family type III secretion protein [Desulfobacterales bacterium]
VDASTVLTTHLSEVIRRNAHELLGRQDVQQLLDTLMGSHPKVVEELVPNLLPLGGVLKVLQNLLMEQVPIRDLLTILETLADWAGATKDIETLTEYVRRGLARTITKLYQGPDGSIPVVTFDPGVEKLITDSIQHTDAGAFLAMEPTIAQKIMNLLAKKLELFAARDSQPVVLCSPQIRAQLKKLIDRFIPELVVLSYNDLMNTAQIQSIGVVRLSDAD